MRYKGKSRRGLNRNLSRLFCLVIGVPALVVLISLYIKESLTSDLYRKQQHMSFSETNVRLLKQGDMKKLDLTALFQGRKRHDKIMSVALPPGRAGNAMFALAALIGIADYNGYQPQLFGQSCYIYEAVFEPFIPCNNSLNNVTFKSVREKQSGVFYRDAFNISKQMNGSKTPVLLQGYFQSWKYFHHKADDFSYYFKFKPITMNRVKSFYEQRIKLRGIEKNPEVVRVIGVHVRRGDMATTLAEMKGYVSAPAAYINNAMIYFEGMYDKKKIIFLVASDDIDWCKKNVNQIHRKVVFSEKFSTSDDLALLASCDDVIITTGTFGWWGAYLAGGRVVYYNQYPLEGSPLSAEMSRRDYYPPTWVGLSELRGEIT